MSSVTGKILPQGLSSFPIQNVMITKGFYRNKRSECSVKYTTVDGRVYYYLPDVHVIDSSNWWNENDITFLNQGDSE